MRTKNGNGKDKIIETAWRLFQEQGFEETTLEDIIREAGTSRGNFYHHFRSKEELLFHMASFFDANYQNWLETLDPDMNSADKLIAFDAFTSRSVEDSPFRPFLAQLYGYEVMTSGERYILLETREYYRVILALFTEGQKRNQISSDRTANELTHIFAGLQRGLVYSWLLEGCHRSLIKQSHFHMQLFIDSVRTDR